MDRREAIETIRGYITGRWDFRLNRQGILYVFMALYTDGWAITYITPRTEPPTEWIYLTDGELEQLAALCPIPCYEQCIIAYNS